MNIPPIGFIGTGNMGSALARAVRRALPEAELFCSNRGPEKAQALAQELGGRAVSGEEAAWQCGLLFLGVKPNGIPGLLESLARPLTQREDPPLLVSMAAGVGLDQLEDLALRCPVVRIMPNTPVSIGQGVTLYTCGQRAKKEDRELVLAALAVLFFIPVLMEYVATGLVLKFPTLIVCGFVMLAAIQSFFAGLILSNMAMKNRRDFEYRFTLVCEKGNRKKQEQTDRS